MNTANLALDRYERNELLAFADAARHAMARLPSPTWYAEHLPLDVVEALERCWPVLGDWRCRYEDQALLASYGLCDAVKPFLSGFGMKVRRALVEVA